MINMKDFQMKLKPEIDELHRVKIENQHIKDTIVVLREKLERLKI